MTPLLRSWRGHLLSAWDGLRSSYWFIPTAMAVAAAAAALGLVELDRGIAAETARHLPWIQDSGPEGTRAVLSAIVGSMITVTGVVFSITIVALTLTSSQFGPRLLRNFLRDRANQLVLGTFVATFLYSLLVLRSVESDAVPYLAAAGAVLLAITSLFVLIYFIHHAASSIQASSVIASVAREIDAELPELFPERLGEEAEVPQAGAREAALARLESDGVEVGAASEGYVRVIDQEGVLQLAVEHDLLVQLRRRPGDFVAAGASLARVGPAKRAPEEMRQALTQRFALGDHRTPVQDLVFLTDQLAEMAVRALSPGVNDPGTAVACLHRLGAVIRAVACRAMPSGLRFDEDGQLRVLARPIRFEDIAASCLDPILRYGAGDASVVLAVLGALEEGAAACPETERRRVLAEYARASHAAFRAGEPPPRDAAAVEEALERALRACAGGRA